MANICIIPARGGSKRIPDKNIRDFMGKPMIAYAIKTALDTGLFDEVMVSTDSQKIADIARKYGANVPFLRSSKTSDDFATTAEVVIEVVSNYQKINLNFDNICILYPCTPLLKFGHILNSYDIFIRNKADSIIPVLQFDYPIQRALRIIQDKVFFLNEEHSSTRNQDLEMYYHDAGQFYWVTSNCIQNRNMILTDNSTYYELNYIDCQDIDTEDDWKIAEIKYRILNNLQ